MSRILYTICVNACIFSYKFIPQVVVLLNALNPTMNLSKRLESTYFMEMYNGWDDTEDERPAALSEIQTAAKAPDSLHT